MRVHYQLTSEEREAAAKYLLTEQPSMVKEQAAERWSRLLIGAIFLYFGVILGQFIGGISEHLTGEVLGLMDDWQSIGALLLLAAALGIPAVGIMLQSRVFRWSRMQDRFPLVSETIVTECDGAMLRFVDRISEVVYRPPALLDVFEAKGMIFVQLRDGGVRSIPRRAFASDSQASEFLTALKKMLPERTERL